MQEKKNKQRAILLVVLLVATISIFWFGQGRNSFKIDKDRFRNFDLKTINRIELQSASGKIELKLEGSRWKVNNRYVADDNMIDVLFATLQQAEPKRPVATTLHDSVSSVLETNGIKVSLWADQELMEAFHAGGNDTKTQAYFKKVNEREPYVMTIPGYRVYVSGIFELGEGGWRDKYVFGFNWRNFQSLETKFSNPANNFIVEMDREFFGIKGLTNIDTARLNNFLDNVSLLTVDEYIQPLSSDSITSTGPIVTIIVKDIADKAYDLKLFPVPQGKRFYGLINDSQWAVFAENKIIPVLKPKEFFIQR